MLARLARRVNLGRWESLCYNRRIHSGGSLIRNRLYSLLIPWFMNGSMALFQTGVPLLATRLDASAMLLGTIGWVPQAIALPVCLTAGHISERIGRARISVPAAIVCAIGCVLLGFTDSNLQLIVLYSLVMAASYAFYPPLQAMIGELSEQGQLRKNLGMFNIGWCTGEAIVGLAAALLLGMGLSSLFFAGAVLSLSSGILVMSWHRRGRGRKAGKEEISAPSCVPNRSQLVLAARIAAAIAFYGYSTVRIMFPKYALNTLHWSEREVALVVAQMLVGLGAGMLVCNAGAWWRAKLWPVVAAAAMVGVSALSAMFTASPAVLGALFFALGAAISVAYTSALYHGLSERENLGKNSGINEGLVAVGGISGCLIGGVVAQHVSLVAPFAVTALVAATSVVAVWVVWLRVPRQPGA